MTTQIIHAYLAPDQEQCPLHVLLMALEWAMKDEAQSDETAANDNVSIHEQELERMTA